MSAAFHCAAVGDSHQWLDCYYGAAQPMRAQLGLSPAPQARIAAQPAAPVPAARVAAAPPPRKKSGGWFSGMFGDDDDAQVPESQFGKPAPDKEGLSAKVDHVVSRMADYKFDHYGIFTVTLANGQVWHQLSGDTDYAHWRKPANTYIASISRGWFGSYNFEVRNNPGLYKVQRER